MPCVDPCTLLIYHNYNFCLRVVSHEKDAIILLAFSSPTHAQSHTLLLPNEWASASLTDCFSVAHPQNTQKQAKDPTEELQELPTWLLWDLFTVKSPKLFGNIVEGPGIRAGRRSVSCALSQKCGLAYWFECYSTVDSGPCRCQGLCSFPFHF